MSIDWEVVWKSLAWDESASSEEAIVARLRERARQYAVPIEMYAPAAARNVLKFTLGDERYGIDVMTVRSVRSVSHITRVPGVPGFYRGVVNVRGQVVTVLDLRLFFDMIVGDEAAPPTELVVARANRLTLGLLAHHVEGVDAIPLEAIEPVDHVRHADGVTADRLVLLNIERLFEDSRLVVGSKDD
jgi:purine-binding chemotaxis protein CheW